MRMRLDPPGVVSWGQLHFLTHPDSGRRKSLPAHFMSTTSQSNSRRNGISPELIEQDKTVAILNAIFILQDLTRQSQIPHRPVNVNAEGLITGPDLVWSGTRAPLLDIADCT